MTGANLTTRMEDIGGIRLIHVSGPLDSKTHDAFRDLLDPLVGQPRFRIVLDCENLNYVNSRGITLMARYQRAAGQSQSFLGIAALNSRISKAIELLGMGQLVKLYPNVAEALQAAAL